MTRCPECQTEAQAGFRFCPSCGSAMAEAPEALSATTAATTPPAGEPPQPAATPPAKAATPSPEEVAEQLRLLAEKEAEKERKKQERLQRMAEKKAERQQRLAAKKVERQQQQAERKALQEQRKLERSQNIPADAPASDSPPAGVKAASTRGWALIVGGIVLAMGAAGTASYFLVAHFL